MISELEIEITDTKKTVSVVKEVGDNAIQTLGETLRVTLEKLEIYEGNASDIRTSEDELSAVQSDNANLKSMIAQLQAVIKQQTEALANKELQLSRISPPRLPRY